MIYSCCCFNGETRLLKILCEELHRLELLTKNKLVTYVLVESKFTFTGIEKPFTFLRTPEFEKYNIEWFPMNEKPHSDPWVNETMLRNSIKPALESLGVQDDDIVIIHDVDEIPRSYAIQRYKKEYGFVALQLDMYYYFLNCRAEQAAWNIPKIMPWSYLKDKQPDQVRRAGYDVAMVQAGWHFSYMGGVESMLNKFKSFSHQEEGVQRLANREVLQGKIDRLESLWSDNKYGIVNNEDLPWYVQQHQEEFKSMLYVR